MARQPSGLGECRSARAYSSYSRTITEVVQATYPSATTAHMSGSPSQFHYLSLRAQRRLPKGTTFGGSGIHSLGLVLVRSHRLVSERVTETMLLRRTCCPQAEEYIVASNTGCEANRWTSTSRLSVCIRETVQISLQRGCARVLRSEVIVYGIRSSAHRPQRTAAYTTTKV